MTDPRTNEDPAMIERDIRKTQDDMSRTVDKIGDQLTMRNIFNALLDKADQHDVDARMIVEGARRNPIALGLIAAGAIWLVSDKDSKFPSMPSRKAKGSGDFDDDGELDVHHRDYVTHMSALEMREGEDPMAYQQRRDIHRSNFLMCERRHDDDDSSFRQRLDELTDKFREKRRAWVDSASRAGTETSRRAQQVAGDAASRAQDMYSSNPLVAGILAAAVGAALGSTIPVSRTEQENLGDVGAKARDMVDDQKEQLTSQIREQKDELLEKAEQKLQQRPSPQESQQTAGKPELGGDSGSNSEGPFLISERTV